MYLLYHNPRCSKSRSCSKILNEKKINFKEILYLKDGLPFSSLNEILDKLINPLSDIIRVNEKEFKEDQFDFYKKGWLSIKNDQLDLSLNNQVLSYAPVIICS